MSAFSLSGFDRRLLEVFFRESPNVAVLILDASARVLSWNAGFSALLPFREDPAGQTIQSLLLPESRRVFKTLRPGDALQTTLNFSVDGAPPHPLEADPCDLSSRP